MGGQPSKGPQTELCEVKVWDYPNKSGRHATFTLSRGWHYKGIRNLNDEGFNDDIQTIELRGHSRCWMRICEDFDFKGRCWKYNGSTIRSFPYGHTQSNIMSSLEFGEHRPPRRLGGLESFEGILDSVDVGESEQDGEDDLDDMIEIEPSETAGLCSAIYEQMFLTEGHMSVETLANECQEVFENDSDARDLCAFNVYAGAQLFDDEEIRGALEMAEQDENAKTELEHCKVIAEEIFNLASAGQLAGVDVMLDGNGDPYYQLQQTMDGADEAATFGAMVALLIGKPIVKIARSIIS